MDESDPWIDFDEHGRCQHCREMEATRGVSWFTDDAGSARLTASLERIKREGMGKDFDCILGLSGGVDSSYVALKLHDWGLRPLAVHVDAGWNSELAVHNIQQILTATGWELHTRVINWEDMRRLQLAFLRSGVSNQDVPQDHAFFAALYRFATDNGVRHVFTGGNTATEGIFPKSWHHEAMDARHVKAINARFGDGPLDDYPTVSFTQYYIWYPQVKRMSTFRPLNFIPYDKRAASAELSERIGWRSYEAKHGESLFTRFYQRYILPERFGYDVRRPHLSSEIVSGQITREQAEAELDKPLYEADDFTRDRDYFLRKLRISRSEFDGLMAVPRAHATDFPNWNKQWRLVKLMQSGVERVSGRKIGVYS